MPTIIRFLLAVVLGAPLVAVETSAAYERRTFTDPAGGSLPYRLLRPQGEDPSRTYPLVLVLHGAGERGDDNGNQLTHGGDLFLEPAHRADFPCFVLFPQCPAGARWVEVDWGEPTSHTQPASPSVPLRRTLALLEALRGELGFDPDRLYVIGLSMGGFGTWDVLARHPGMFAAGVPICGGADDSTAPALAGMPIWAFHGDADQVVYPARSRSMIAALRAAGGDPLYREYAGVGHESWLQAFAEPELLPWLFAQRRASAPGGAGLGIARAGTAIADGGTDALGSAAAVTRSLTYVLSNGGSTGLTMVVPVTITGAENCNAIVTSQPEATIAAGATSELVVQVTPTAAGEWSFVLTVARADSSADPYTWTVSGTALANPGTPTSGVETGSAGPASSGGGGRGCGLGGGIALVLMLGVGLWGRARH